MTSNHDKYRRLIDYCRTLPPTPTAVVHPCDQSSLQGAVDAAKNGLIAPILVGPRERIEEVASAGAAGVAAIGLFANGHVEDVVAAIRRTFDTAKCGL